MKKYLKKLSEYIARALLFLCVLLLSPIYVFAGWTDQSNAIDPEKTGGWTPTDAGLVVQLHPHETFRLSTVINEVEYFVCDYGSYPQAGQTSIFGYTTGDYLKLIPRNPDGTAPDGSLWTVGAPLTTRVGGKEYDLVKGIDGIFYTMLSDEGRTPRTNDDNWTFVGTLTTDKTNNNACNVAFAIPTIRARVNMDPNNTLGKKVGDQWAFDGQMGVDALGNVWREVYWFHKTRVNGPYSYAATGLTAFEKRTSPPSGDKTTYGRAYQINGKSTGKGKPRMLFRLYIVADHPFESCPNSYFFAHDEQNYLKFLKFNSGTPTSSDSTEARKIYTHDVVHCMERVGDTKYYQTEPHQISTKDSSFYYVGKHNNFFANRGTNPPTLGPTAGSFSAFKNIHQLRIRHLENESTPFIAPAGATGRFVVDTTSGAENLGVTFDPVGYFFRTSSGVNVPMVQVDDTTWITATMWHIEGEYMNLSGEVMLYSGTTFSATDPGVPIAGWSQMVPAPTIPVYGHPGWTAAGRYGWARIHTNRPATNGGIEFVLANTTGNYVEYSNNGHFGVELPNLYPFEGSTTVTIQEPQLLNSYTFYGWNTQADGNGVTIDPGTTIDFNALPTGVTLDGNALKLYAKAEYTGSINVAMSFVHSDGKRYFLTQPDTKAPRFAHARTYTDWTDVYQGMSDADNSGSNYMSSYTIIGNPGVCVECNPGEYVLDPRRETMYGAVDSLTFYDQFAPPDMEYIGLYYDNPYSILANENWAGLFRSSKGWPTPVQPCVDSTILSSSYYLTGWPSSVRNPRGGAPADSIIRYQAGQFDAVASDGTPFMLSGVGVVDEHYVILPDTTDAETPWTDSIIFPWHVNTLPVKQVWSKLIGKQLMAQMKVGEDTVYFHPNRDKIISDANALMTSRDFRLTHAFNFIRDARVEALHVVDNEDKATYGETASAYHCTITSGKNSPMDVQLPGGQYIDMVDTLRVWLQPTESSKIKNYYGRWNDNAPGVHRLADGSRYRDILVKTKTYHYGNERHELRLIPAKTSYSFGSLDGFSEDVNFTLQLVTTHDLLDAQGVFVRVDTVSVKDTTSLLNLNTATINLVESDIFKLGATTNTGVRLTTLTENITAPNRDTLTVSATVTLGGVPSVVTVRVPLLQVSTQGQELVWSVDYNGTRYFIIGATATPDQDANKLRIQTFSKTGNRLVRNNQELKLGSTTGTADRNYIRPWKWHDVSSNQLTLKTEYGVNLFFNIKDDGVTAEGNSTDSVALTYNIVGTYTNSNGNYEELVYIKYVDKWLKLDMSGSKPKLIFTTDESQATLFNWGYMLKEYNLSNNGSYPSRTQQEFGYNAVLSVNFQTRYYAYLDHSMLLNNELVYLCKTEEKDIADLISSSQDWKTLYTDSIIRDSRVATPSGLSISNINTSTLTTTITSSATSPTEVKYNGQYVNIVDTLDFRITLQDGAPDYRFAGSWSSYSSVEDAHLKIPLIRRTYHEVPYDSIRCLEIDDEYNHAFPAILRDGVPADSLHTFYLMTQRRKGKKVYNVAEELVANIVEYTVDSTSAMDMTNIALAEVRLMDDRGNAPSWCKLERINKSDVTVRCLTNGIRTPRIAYLYFAYIVIIEGKMRFVNFRLTVSQASHYYSPNNQQLYHTAGASGDPMTEEGKQQVHENKRILYYYNPAPYGEPDQNVELPVRERGFYGWWRWYREGADQNGNDVSDSDVPDSVWNQPPRNTGKYNYPFRVIGDSVNVLNPRHGEPGQPDSIKQLVTMGRYTVFRYPSNGYNSKANPPSKSPRVYPPFNEDTVTYVVDISNYTDNLPLSTKQGQKNQIDTARLDTMPIIKEPTLSLREIFELHPWTEMAERMEHYKTSKNGPFTDDKYMEDHVVMAPVGNRLLLRTEQRYDYSHFAEQKDKNGNVIKEAHSESLLGYYMRDDNWNDWAGDKACQDTMIWCGGWDADCSWYTYNPGTHTYETCLHPTTIDDDFLQVPAKTSISAGNEYDTVYYCLRSRSVKTSDPADIDSSEPGDYWFNICRYMVVYHNIDKYGPMIETNVGGVMKALKTNKEIEENYEILEKLNFDYDELDHEYHIYPHPLPWSDASYGYTYPVSPSLPQNRYHDEKDFPGPGEYALINKIPNYHPDWWRPIAQHGGDSAGYMIYCDGMSAAGQVAALKLKTNLCEGQKLFFSAYVGNASAQKNKSNPNFTFSVQGSKNDTLWEDISSFMTGDIQPSDNWYQILFPIEHEQAYDYFRVRIYNMASDFEGNDFIIDDMCVYATKPPLIAYQANTKCVEANENDSVIHVVLRVDYQGFIDDHFNGDSVHYTVEKVTRDGVHSFVPMIDGYLNDSIIEATDPSKPDTIFGWIPMPAKDYEPNDEDSIFLNLNKLADRFEQSVDSQKVHPEWPLFRQGYIYENLDGDIRPVLYIVHKAKMTANNEYYVRMSLGYEGLMNSQCAMTSNLKVTNRMMLMLNGEEQEDNAVHGICGNVTHDLSLRVKGTLIQDSVAPIDISGTCMNDWLLYGDTAEASSEIRYGYCYSDIVKVVKEILRYEPMPGETNVNQFARTLGAVSKPTMKRIKDAYNIQLKTTHHPYTVLKNLVENGFLILYQSDMMVAMEPGDSVQYVIFPILGTGSDDMHEQNMEVCPTPLVITLKAKENELGIPMVIGGLQRDSTQLKTPIVVLADGNAISEGVRIPVDSIRTLIGVNAIYLTSTDDPDYHEGIHKLEMTPDRTWPGDFESYYVKGDTIVITPSSSNTYEMRQGYNYTYTMEMVTPSGEANDTSGCPIGNVLFTLAYVPDYLRWNPQSEESNSWNNSDNWIGINDQNKTIHDDARFAPLPSTKVIIPQLPDSLPYPELKGTITSGDSVQKVGFAYNVCDAIRFLPGAAIGQQQHLLYNDAIIDMRIPNQSWALRAAPVTGMISGDLFMSNADLLNNSDPWMVGEFDSNGRNNTIGNGAFYLSVYNRETTHFGNGQNIKDTTYTASAEWSKVTNGMTLSLPPASGWAVYARTKSGKAADLRLPKNDDVYYYYTKSGEKSGSENELRAKRDENAGGSGKAGRMAFQPDGASQNYPIASKNAQSIVFGNPTMGYIDIWGFITDNTTYLADEISYLDDKGYHTPVSKATAMATKDTINELMRYLPPMRAIVIKLQDGVPENATVRLDGTRIVTRAVSYVAPSAPSRRSDTGHSKGIMTVTALNSVSPRCVSRLRIGQGYHDEVLQGEDAVLTTYNIDNFHMTNTPTTPFNIYSVDNGFGLSIDLRDKVVNIPVSFYMSDLPYDPVTSLWFTGVNRIDGPLVFYDEFTDTAVPIIDGICIDIETPQENHQTRYYIRRPDYKPENPDNPIATGVDTWGTNSEQAYKYIRNGIVYILRNGHVYTMFGQKIR